MPSIEKKLTNQGLAGSLLITEFNLYPAYPNPFNLVTTLRYDLPEDAMVNITIYDMMGRALLLYRIEAGDPLASSGYSFRRTRKIVLLK